MNGVKAFVYSFFRCTFEPAKNLPLGRQMFEGTIFTNKNLPVVYVLVFLLSLGGATF